MRSPNSVECTSSAKGQCYSIQGNFRSREMPCNGHCSEYKTWRYLADR